MCILILQADRLTNEKGHRYSVLLLKVCVEGKGVCVEEGVCV